MENLKTKSGLDFGFLASVFGLGGILITLITGGVRSGKSSYALQLANERGTKKCFIATAEARDGEMRGRILRHREERGESFDTIEEPLYLARAIRRVRADRDLVLVDCLTLWVSNLLHQFEIDSLRIADQFQELLHVLEEKNSAFIFVTNEVGYGIVPDNALSRRYIDELGRLNRIIAQRAQEVILMTCGIPTAIKGGIGAPLGQ